MRAPVSKGRGIDQRSLDLIDDIAGFFDDPLGYVLFAFPWGEPGQLADATGPDDWQRDLLREVGEQIRERADPASAVRTAIQAAVASGHGVGKTGLVAWIILWFMSTREFPQIVVTANTKNQLDTKTWRELAKWHKLAINRDWFDWTATRFAHVMYPETWFASAIPWSEHNSEAFAGTHEKHVLVIFDEASAVANVIWEVTEGAMTTPGAMWLAFGNPTQNTGRFAECFGRLKHRWTTRQVDSRTAKMANRAQIQQWIDDYGEDHDFVRVRVRGVFPRAGTLQFISGEMVREAMQRQAVGFDRAPIVMGVDVARHGDDQSVICIRQGNHLWPMEKFRIDDLTVLAEIVSVRIQEINPDAIFVDATGMGWGVVDTLRKMGYGNRLFAVQTGQAAIEDKKYFNKRAELWGRMRDWIREGGCLPNDTELETDLTAPEYGHDNKFRVQLEKKEDMKARGLASPDAADSLALTFASVVQARDRKKESWRDRLKKTNSGRSGMAA